MLLDGQTDYCATGCIGTVTGYFYFILFFYFMHKAKKVSSFLFLFLFLFFSYSRDWSVVFASRDRGLVWSGLAGSSGLVVIWSRWVIWSRGHLAGSSGLVVIWSRWVIWSRGHLAGSSGLVWSASSCPSSCPTHI